MTEPILIDVAAAAVLANTTPDVIRQWARRGHITRHGTRGRRLYDAREIARHTKARAGQDATGLSRSDADGPRVPAPGSSPLAGR